jgi:hypothetical protein
MNVSYVNDMSRARRLAPSDLSLHSVALDFPFELQTYL